ncbi:MAG: glycosyltransferase family 1 protein [Myxococcota bacterium]
MRARPMDALGIDARMLGPSGIGRYLEALLPRVIAALAPRPIVVLGRRETLAAVPSWSRASHVSLRACDAPVYGPTEQLALARATRGLPFFWSPHVNVPLGFRGRGLVATIHDTYHLRPEAEGTVRVDKRLHLRQLYRGAARHSARILCVSAFGATEVQRWLGIPAARIAVAPNGVDGAAFGARPGDARTHPRPYALFVGNDKPHKNLRRLVAAFDRIADHTDLDLLVVGACDRLDEYNARPARIHRRPDIDHDELRRLYAQATLLVAPSLYEGFGLPPLEAMASGTPVIAARAASLPEVCGDAALYVEPYRVDDLAAALVALDRDPEARRRQVAAGAERVRHFTWERTAATTVEALQTVLST